MKEPKGSVLLLALTVFIVAESAPVIQEEKLPHSQDYYDGYVKALVDHFDDLFRNVRDVSADNSESKIVSQQATKKDDVQNADANNENNGVSRKSQQASDQNNTVQDHPYVNPEETGKPPVTDTEKEEQPTPDAHLNKEDKQISTSTEEAKQNMLKAEDATNSPETMQDIKLYTGKSKDFEDMKKRSTDSEASTFEKSITAKTFVVKPAGSSPPSLSTAPAAAPVVAQIAGRDTQTVAASANAPVASSAIKPVAASSVAPVVAPVSLPAALSVTEAVQSPVASAATSAAVSLVSQSNPANAKRNDMQSESKIISHSSATYTPGDPYKTPPQQTPTPPDPNKEEPYKKDEKSESEGEEEKQKDAGNSKSKEESFKEEERAEEGLEEEKNEDANKNVEEAENNENNEAAENVENLDTKTKEGEKEFRKDSDEDDTEEELASTPVQPFMEMVMLPIEETQDAGNLLASAGERKNNVGVKRGDDDKKKDDKKDDDDDDEDHDHAYLAPLCGYPGWYEAGHGFPYGYGTNMLYGHHGHHCAGLGDAGFGLHGFGHHGIGYHGAGYGHHGLGYGHHGLGYGHHGFGYGHPGYGYGHGGFGHHGGLRLDNGVIWPYGGEVVAFFHTPCGCNSEPVHSDM